MSQLDSLHLNAPIVTTPVPGTQPAEASRTPLSTAVNGGPAITSQLDTKQVMSHVPEQDLPAATRDARNKETSQTLEIRSLSAGADPVQPQGSTPAEGANGPTQTETLRTEGTGATQDIVTEIPLPAGHDTQEVLLAVPEVLLNVVSSMQKGLTRKDAPDLATLKDWSGQLDRMVEQLKSVETSDAATRIQAMVQQTKMQVQNAIISRGHLEDRLTLLTEMKNADLPAADRFRNITDVFTRVWQAGITQEQAARALLSGVPEVQLEAMKAFDSGITMLGSDHVTFEKALTAAMADLVAELAPDCRLSHDTLASLCLLTLHSGHDPVEMQAILSSAPQWAFTPAHEAALAEAMARGIIDTRFEAPEAQRGATLRWVDMLFQGAKFEASSQALALKKLLLPGHQAEAELQHQCVTASSHLFNTVLAAFTKESPSSFHTRTGTLDRAAQGVSAHSLVLTPSLVKTLSKNVSIPNFNYHLAHVALLQKRAMQAGLFTVADVNVKAQMLSARTWCRTLGLDEATANYAGELDDALSKGGKRAVQLTKRLVGASAHFVQGFEGQSGLAKAGSSVIGAAKMTGAFGHDNRSIKIFNSSTSFKARTVLDRLVVNLSTTEEARRRFADGSQDFALNGDLVDQGICERNTAAINEILRHSRAATALLAGDSAQSSTIIMDTELERALDQRLITRKEALKEAAELKAHLSLMDSIASASKETVRLVDRGRALSADIASMKAAASTVSFSWPHQRAAREEVCRHVIEIERLHNEAKRLEAGMAKDPGNEPLLRYALQERDAHLAALEGVHPLSLVPRSRLAGKTPTLDVVLDHMLPRAKALRYFNAPIYVNGLKSTRAKEALSRLDQLGDALLDQHEIIDKGLKKLGKAIGSSSAKRLRQSVSAAVLKVYAESQEPVSTFDVNAHRDRIEAQLRTWSLEPGLRLTKLLVDIGLNEMTDRNGHLRDTWLTHTMKDMDFSLARETAAAGLREEGRSWLTAHIKAKKAVEAMLTPESRRLNEGVRGLMDQASLPGSGFNYSRSRGLFVDTGSVFSPLSSDNGLISTIDLSHQLSVRFKAMHDNSIMVANLGNGSYQVMLKGGATGSLGATMKFDLGAGFKAPVGGNLTGKHGEGIALTFTSRADTEAFLLAFMDPKSGLHLKPWEKAPSAKASPDALRANGYDPSVWLKASQIRFVTDNSVSLDVSVGLMYGAVKALPLPAALSANAALNFSAQGSLTSSVQQNVHGEEAVFSLKGRITGVESLSGGLIAGGGTKLFSSPLTTQKEVRSVDVEQRFKLVTGEQGIMPQTCMETELSAGSVDHRVFRALFLPPGMSDKISNDPEINRKFTSFLRGLPPSARLTVRYALKPAVLADVRERFLKARLAPAAQRDIMLQKIHDLLDDTDSYEAASIQAKALKPVAVSKNWSPGLGHAQYKRETSFAQFVPLKTLDLATMTVRPAARH